MESHHYLKKEMKQIQRCWCDTCIPVWQVQLRSQQQDGSLVAMYKTQKYSTVSEVNVLVCVCVCACVCVCVYIRACMCATVHMCDH